MTASSVNQIDRRRIEAEIMADTYAVLINRMSEAQALEIIREATATAARRAGTHFAKAAPDGPNLQHFATVVNLWRAGGALNIEGEALEGNVFRLTVTRCGYAELYMKDMGLPSPLAEALSCSRDAAFAAGYSPRIRLERPETIAGGAACCEFVFRWGRTGTASNGKQPDDF